MKLGTVPENLFERLILRRGVVPTPLLDTHIAMLLCRALMEATRLGIFDALAGEALDAAAVAVRCGTHPAATKKLLDGLAGAEYLTYDQGRYACAPVARKWLVKDAPLSLREKLLWQFVEWDWMSRLDAYMRTGNGLDFHRHLLPGDWRQYQRGMRAGANIEASEIARRTPVPRGARTMLDIGGSHGLFSVAICRRHPRLTSTILELPEAIEEAAALLAREGLGERVRHQAGNVLTEDLGDNQWDVVLMSQLAHHFNEATNRDIARRVARALRPDGVFVIQELIRPETPKDGGQVGALLDLYFALTSEAGTWSFEEMAGWQRDAGLVPKRPVKLLTAPGIGQQVGIRRGASR